MLAMFTQFYLIIIPPTRFTYFLLPLLFFFYWKCSSQTEKNINKFSISYWNHFQINKYQFHQNSNSQEIESFFLIVLLFIIFYNFLWSWNVIAHWVQWGKFIFLMTFGYARFALCLTILLNYNFKDEGEILLKYQFFIWIFLFKNMKMKDEESFMKRCGNFITLRLNIFFNIHIKCNFMQKV